MRFLALCLAFVWAGTVLQAEASDYVMSQSSAAKCLKKKNYVCAVKAYIKEIRTRSKPQEIAYITGKIDEILLNDKAFSLAFLRNTLTDLRGVLKGRHNALYLKTAERLKQIEGIYHDEGDPDTPDRAQYSHLWDEFRSLVNGAAASDPVGRGIPDGYPVFRACILSFILQAAGKDAKGFPINDPKWPLYRAFGRLMGGEMSQIPELENMYVSGKAEAGLFPLFEYYFRQYYQQDGSRQELPDEARKRLEELRGRYVPQM